MIGNLLFLVAITAVLVFYEKSRDTEDSRANKALNPRARRLERPLLEDQGTRGRLQASLEATKELEVPGARDRAITAIA